MEIQTWMERAEKILQGAGGFDLTEAVKLAEEIRRFSAYPIHGGAVNFLSQAKGKRMDDHKLASCRNYFYRLILILKEQKAPDSSLSE